LPKIPSGNVFNNAVSNLEHDYLTMADDAFAKGNTSIQNINLADIIPTQKNINIDNLKSINNIDELPELMFSNGKYYVRDGHHRISRDILTGDKAINAKVYGGQ